MPASEIDDEKPFQKNFDNLWMQSKPSQGIRTRQAVNGFESGSLTDLDAAPGSSLFSVALEDVFIYRPKEYYTTLVEQFKNYFGFEFGSERFTERLDACDPSLRNRALRASANRAQNIYGWLVRLINHNKRSFAEK